MASVSEILAQPLKHDDAVPTSVIVVVAALNPKTGEENLYVRWDEESSAWKLLGMAQLAYNDIIGSCRTVDD